MHMRFYRLGALIGFAALLAAPFPGMASARTAYRRHSVQRTYRRPIAPYWRPGSTAGWRWRSNYGWDNTCLDVPWLASEFACSAHGR